MNAFKKTIVAIAAAATLGGIALGPTQALAWCNDGYYSYDYSPSYYSPSYYSYGWYGYHHYDFDHHDFDHHREYGHRH